MSWASETVWWRFGRVIGRDGFRYYFDARDAMWLARALRGETLVGGNPEDKRGVFWAMVNRMYLMRGRPLHRLGYDSLPWPWRYADLLLAYCSPINPARRETEWQHRLAAMQPEEFDTQDVAYARHFIGGHSGPAGRFAGIVDFAARNWTEGTERHGTPDLSLDNAFWRNTESRYWTPDEVRVVGPSTSLAVPLLVGAGIVGAAFAAKRFWPAAFAAIPFLPP